MSRTAIACASIAVLLSSVAVAVAQDAAPRPRSLEVSVGALAIGGVDFGSHNANLTANDPGNPDFILFTTSSQINPGAGLDTRVTFNLSRTFGVEGAFAWTRQTAETKITSDADGAPNVTLTEDLSTYFVEAAAVVHLRRLGFARGRGLPFVFAGGGYLRQLDGDSILVDTGTVFHAGGGIKYFFAQRVRGFVRDIGLRADGRFYVRSGGLELGADQGQGVADGARETKEEKRRATWALAGGVVMRF
jgi:opacity protein-like surface antigen